MSADHHKQIGIRGGARSFQLGGGSIKQKESFEKSQERPIRKILKPVAILSWSLDLLTLSLLVLPLIS
jgi:hypothetical protein